MYAFGTIWQGRRMNAKYNGWCKQCGSVIKAGDEITKKSMGWVCERCAG